MGCSPSYAEMAGMTRESAAVEAKKNMEIQKSLRLDHRATKHVNRILLLGASECGKSTILKQMKIMHLDGFTAKERKYQRRIIRVNAVEGLQQIIHACFDLELKKDKAFQTYSYKALKLTPASANGISSEHLKAIVTLWEESSTIAEAVASRHKFYVLDSAPYFLRKLDEIFEEKYIPSDKDILHARLCKRAAFQ
mmetsp:Transcript_17372/g.26059  ORF Transcript_17372/g.26059 Transcript_17372/m.26059 type:complete len:195 (+) Transcript_17372:115-699(+)